MGLILGKNFGFGSLLLSDIFSSFVNFLFLTEGIRIDCEKTSDGKIFTSIENDSNLLKICTIAQVRFFVRIFLKFLNHYLQITQILLNINEAEIITSDVICDSKLIKAFQQVICEPLIVIVKL